MAVTLFALAILSLVRSFLYDDDNNSLGTQLITLARGGPLA